MKKLFNVNFLPRRYRANARGIGGLINKFLRSESRLKVTMLTIFLGILSLGLIQTSSLAQKGAAPVSKAEAQTITGDVSKIMFGADADQNETNQILEKQVKLVSSRPAFLPSLNVIKKHEDEIRRVARAKGVPEDIAIGIFLLENGGSEYAISVAGAAGIAQLMPGTARAQGLVVNAQRDDRANPSKSIEAGLSYLLENYRLLGDWGLTTWSYHAGAGNVCKAVRIYAENRFDQALAGCNPTTAQFVKNRNITVHDVLSNGAVQTRVTSRLYDDSAGYPYKVMATAHLFALSKKLGQHEFWQRVALLNSGGMNIQDISS